MIGMLLKRIKALEIEVAKLSDGTPIEVNDELEEKLQAILKKIEDDAKDDVPFWSSKF